MAKHSLKISTFSLALILSVTPLLAAQPAPKISKEAATQTALKAVPHGTIKSMELETEHGKQIYSFDITQPGKTGVTEVHVSAVTGRVVEKKHEGPLKERLENAMEPKMRKSK